MYLVYDGSKEYYSNSIKIYEDAGKFTATYVLRNVMHDGVIDYIKIYGPTIVMSLDNLFVVVFQAGFEPQIIHTIHVFGSIIYWDTLYIWHKDSFGSMLNIWNVTNIKQDKYVCCQVSTDVDPLVLLVIHKKQKNRDVYMDQVDYGKCPLQKYMSRGTCWTSKFVDAIIFCDSF